MSMGGRERTTEFQLWSVILLRNWAEKCPGSLSWATVSGEAHRSLLLVQPFLHLHPIRPSAHHPSPITEAVVPDTAQDYCGPSEQAPSDAVAILLWVTPHCTPSCRRMNEKSRSLSSRCPTAHCIYSNKVPIKKRVKACSAPI